MCISCLPQSETASADAGEGEYVSLYSSGQSSKELALSGGVSNLEAACACGLAQPLLPAEQPSH